MIAQPSVQAAASGCHVPPLARHAAHSSVGSAVAVAGEAGDSFDVGDFAGGPEEELQAISAVKVTTRLVIRMGAALGQRFWLGILAGPLPRLGTSPCQAAEEHLRLLGRVALDVREAHRRAGEGPGPLGDETSVIIVEL